MYQKTIGKFKDNSVFILNDTENNLHDKMIEKDMENRNKNKLSVNVGNGKVLLKQLLGEKLLSFKKKN